ncbi:hypothetical protein F0562_030390 [Nyssa sinensis]|uniref:Uncharacterized protein n=1 Tax=Nyssa sinensis TaxID=561372 RepID=A0A5J5B0V4_9ASTE|nr:hypothetical protein F0562_030390 [Nyssa sinensis]
MTPCTGLCWGMEYLQTICISIEFLKNSWAFIRECYNYHELLDEKRQTLKRRMEALRCREKDVHDELRNSQYDSGKKRKREVENWFQNVRQKITEVQEVEQNAGLRRYLSRSHFLRIVDKNIQEVNKLMEQGGFVEGLLIDVHDQRGEVLLTTPLVGQTTAERSLEKIWKFLMDDEMTRIGVYGMGGVGKTTVMTHIHNRLLENPSLAHHVCWVTVSQESSIHKLQNEIAKCIHTDLLKENDERKRAAMLYQALRRIKKFVVILDDMWKVFLPEDIGIPVGVEEGRLLITTRSLEVCRGMQCQQSIKVESLSTEEAWDLFMKNVWSDKVVDKKVEEIARSIAMECAGLPLAIVTTARSMRGVDDIHDWQNALSELKRPIMGLVDREEEVFKPLKFSYDRLKHEKLQRCFLYCASFPEDYYIPRVELIVYWIAEGLLDERGTRKAQYDMGHSILNKLENVCLLERPGGGNPPYYVKMHDVIRDMALNITKENDSAIFKVKSGERSLHVTNRREWSENLERVFLAGDIIEEYLSPSISPKCPRLLTLQLHDNDYIIELPNSFFVHMQSLRVLVLSYMDKLERLPDSISNLKSLRGLFLNGCSNLECVPSLAELKELREVHLHESGVKAVPTGLKGLVNLKCLDLSSVSGIQSIPTGLLPSLSNLQCLRLDGCNIDVQTEELITLRQIEMLGVSFSNLDKFNSYVCTKDWERLSHYHLQIQNSDERFVLPWLKCREVSIYCIDHVILLPTNMQQLNIVDCVLPTSLLDISPSLNENTCKDLEKCFIGSSEGIEDLWSFTTTTTSVPQNLKVLTVYSLPDLRSLFKYEGIEMGGRPPAESGTFSHLKLLNVYNCGKLKYLLTARLVRHHMQNLELIHVRDCSQMEHIIIEEEEEGISTERNSILTFSKLRTLKLVDVPELKSICIGTKTMVCPSLQEINVLNCPKLKRLSLSTMNMDDSRRTSETQLDSLIKIRGQKEWWDLLEWDNPEAKSVLQFSILEEMDFYRRYKDFATWPTSCYEDFLHLSGFSLGCQPIWDSCV